MIPSSHLKKLDYSRWKKVDLSLLGGKQKYETDIRELDFPFV
jgi:hypothetical protein